MSDWRYTLTPDELQRCERAARQISSQSIRKGLTQKLAVGDNVKANLLGRCGEVAVARLLGLPYSIETEAAKGPHKGDVSGGLEVRAREREHYELWSYPGDDQWSIFVLVTGPLPTLWARGWLRGYDVQQDAHWRAEPWMRVPGWLIPASGLRPMESLPLCLLCNLPASHWHSIPDALRLQRAREAIAA